MIRGAFPPITTRQSFVDDIECFSDDDDTPFDLTGATAQVAIVAAGEPWYASRHSVSYYDCWPGSPRLLATTADGSALVLAGGVIHFTFTAAQIASLCPGQYIIAANIARDGETVQLILGDLAVLDGVVPQ